MSDAPLKPRPEGLNAGWVKKLLKWGGRAHVVAYRASRGRIGGTWRVGAGWSKPVPILLLDHVGRKSGRSFTTPLLHLADGGDAVVVASSGGMDREPLWFANLMAHPDTTILIRGERRAVRAREATPAERERLWPMLVDLYADFASYATWTERVIPVVILTPR